MARRAVVFAALALAVGAGLSQAASFAATAGPAVPVANNDSASVNEDLVVDINVLANDTDADDPTLGISTFTHGANGMVTLVSGRLRYDSDPDFNGTDTFTYRATDGANLSNTATVTVTVNAVNDDPIANNDSKTTAEDTAFSFPSSDLLANDTPGPPDEGVAGQTLRVTAVSAISGGTPSINLASGTITFTPTANFNTTANGPASFRYTVRDNGSPEKSDTGTVNVTITPVNDAPVAVNDAYTVNEDTVLTVAAPGVLTNDTDVDSTSFTASKITDPASGTATLNSNGSLSYTPQANFNGNVSFTYRASDGSLNSNTATVTITVVSVNDQPTPVNDTGATSEDVPVTFTTAELMADDSPGPANEGTQTLSFTGVSAPVNGTVSLEGGSVTFTPAADFNGNARFTYTVTDNGTTNGAPDPRSASADVVITVLRVNDPPTAAADTKTTTEDTAVSFPAGDLLLNDSGGPADESGQMLTLTAVGSPANGTVDLTGGTITFTPNPNFFGAASFSYTIVDDGTTSGAPDPKQATGTVTVNVSGVSDGPPVAADDEVTTPEDTTLNSFVPVTDPDGEPLTHTLVDLPPDGLTFRADGTYTYVPPSNFHGVVSFTYKANDGTTDSNVATVTITVTSVNDAPVATGDDYETDEDTVLTFAAAELTVNDIPGPADENGQTLSVTGVSSGVGGSVSLNAGTGMITFTPTLNYNGSATFGYTVRDNGTPPAESTGIVSVSVAAVNDAPTAHNDAETTAEDTPLSALVPAATEVDGQAVTYAQVGVLPGLTFNPDGSYLYTPASNFNGQVTFTYKANDGIVDSNTATVTITVTPVNDVPVAGDDAKAAVEDTPRTIPAAELLENDSRGPTDESGQTLSVSAVGSPVGGTVELVGANVVFTPAANFNGNAGFAYTVIDNGTTNGVFDPRSDSGNVSVSVSEVNDNPNAATDSATTPEDNAVQITAAQLLGNDTPGPANESGQTLTLSSVQSAVNGTVALAGTTVTFTPTANFNGTGSFVYTVGDNGTTNGLADPKQATAAVTVTVTPVNDAPVAQNDARTTLEDTPLSAQVPAATDIEGQAVTYAQVGVLPGLTFNSNGSYLYTPPSDFNGQVTFSYRASDGALDSNQATVTITVTPVNDRPVANPDSYTTNEDTVLSFPAAELAGNDSPGPTDEIDQSLSVTAVGTAVNGTVALAGTTITFTPTANFNGTASFPYTVRDNGTPQESSSGTVTVTVAAVNDAPVAQNDAKTTLEDTPLSAVVPAATDVEGQAVTYTQVGALSGLTFNPDGSYLYTPASNFNGQVTFTYKANDGQVDSNVATVTITVTAVNDAPVAVNDGYSVAEDGVLTVAAPGVLGNDNDIEGSPLSAVQAFSPSHGTLTLDANGSLAYTPVANFHGSDTFTYRASDGSLSSNVATVTVTVTPVNDAPAAQDDAKSTGEDTVLNTSVPAASDVDGDSVTYVLVAGTPGLSFNSNGTYVYTPPANSNGTATFTYKARDALVDSNVATVRITVNPVNDAPTAIDGTAAVDEDSGPLQIDLATLVADVETADANLSYEIVSGPSGGTLSSIGAVRSYTPNTDFNGSDSFTYRVTDRGDPDNCGAPSASCDGAETSLIKQLSITVNPRNDAPVLNNSGAPVLSSIAEDATGPAGNTVAAILASGAGADPISDVDAGALEGIAITGTDSANGTWQYSLDDGATWSAVGTSDAAARALAPAAKLRFLPAANFNGSASVDFRAWDQTSGVSGAIVDTTTNGGTSAFSTAKETATVTVTPVNDSPVAQNQSVTTAEDTAGVITLGATDIDSGALTYSVVAGPVHGSLSGTAPNLTYTPAANYHGPDSFTFRASDGTADSNVATVSITVTPTNDAPVAANQNQTTAEDTAKAITLAATDVDSGALTYTVVTEPSHGTLTGTAPNLTYAPAANYNGPDSVTFKANDGTLDSNVATVTITVNAVNDAPVAANQNQTTAEDTAKAITLAATDVDSGALTYSVVAGPANGSLSGTAPNLSYTPAADYHGGDSFTFKANDGSADSNVATVTITVTPVADAPSATDDAATTAEETAVEIDVLANDSDADGQTPTIASFSQGASGSVELVAGKLRYTPVLNFTGNDSFSYRANDGVNLSNLASVTVTVTPVNDAPVAAGDSYGVGEDGSLSVPAAGVLANDSDVDSAGLSAVLVSGTSNGTLTLNADGSFSYAPNANFNGADSFTYRASDGSLTSNLATVTITVTAVNDAPVAANDSYSVGEDGNLAVAAVNGVLANDSDVDSTGLTAALVGDVTHGTLTLDPNGSFTYAPNGNFNGTDSFTYRASDGTASSNLASVTIAVNAVNDAPVAGNDTYSVGEDGSLNVPAAGVLANDSDVDSTSLSAVLVATATKGTLTLNANGSFSYAPNADFNGSDSFTYRASDGSLTSNLATVTITVTAVNDAPVAANDSYSVGEDGNLAVAAVNGVLANDSDVDSTGLTAALVGNPNSGTLTLDPNGSFSYTPNGNFNGTDSFTYQAGDGTASSNLATVTITVNAVNDAPVLDNTGTPTLNTITEDAVNPAGTAVAAILASGAGGDPISDVDAGALEGIAVTSADSANGTWQYSLDNGATWNAVGTSDAAARVLAPAAKLRFLPAANFNGSASVEFRAWDQTSGVSGAIVDTTVNGGTSAFSTAKEQPAISVTPVNDAPAASDGGASMNEDGGTVAIDLGALVSDLESADAALTYTIVSGPTSGSLSGTGASRSYTPALNFNGTDSFTYQASDGELESELATVTITVNAVNDPPVAVDDTATTARNTATDIAVVANDSDIDGGAPSVTAVTDPLHGAAAINLNGTVRYTPDTGYVGPDSFDYTISDGQGGVDTGTVTVTVSSGSPPVAADDAYSVAEDGSLSVPGPGVLGNDTDPELDALTAGLVTNVASGVLALNANGSFTYTPSANFNGTASFTYRADDGALTSNLATVTITVTAVNDSPSASDGSASVNEDGGPAAIDLATLVSDVETADTGLTYTIVTGPSNGSLSGTGASRSYTPAPNFNGTDSFTYQASDGELVSNVATVRITVTAVNDAPVLDDTGSPTLTAVTEDAINPTGTTVAAILASGAGADPISDVDAGALEGIAVTGTDAANGTWQYSLDDGVSWSAVGTSDAAARALAPGAKLRFLPNANFNGPANVEFRAWDQTSGVNGGIVDTTLNGGTSAFSAAKEQATITVTSVNDAPVAADDSYAVGEDGTLTITAAAGVLANDSDIDSTGLTAALVGNVSNGTLALNANGSFTYTPNPNFNGSDSFTYRASDSLLTSNLATVTITVNAVNDAPSAANDSYSVGEDGSLTVAAATGVLANDTDAEGSSLSAVLVATTTKGTLTLAADGSFSYTPNANVNGTDTFTYRASDGTASSNLATVTITVAAVNDAPVAADDSYATSEGTPLTIAAPGVLDNDSDVEGTSLSAVLELGPSNGTLSLNANGSFTYTPNASFNGSDSFTYKANDGLLNSNVVTVTITVGAVNDAPQALNDSYSVDEDGSLAILAPGVLGNDSDAEGSSLSAVLVATTTNGTLTLNANGSFSYVPNANVNGSDSFTYRASDGSASSNLATVTITVNAVNDAPVAANQDQTTAEDTAKAITLAASDVDSASLTYTVVTGPSHGTLTGTAPSLTYTPAANYHGGDSFTFRASDGTANSNVATVSITVTPVNDAPVAANDGHSVAEDGSLTVAAPGVLGNDSDVEGTALSAELVASPTNGTLALDPDGSFVYTPNANFHGSDSFTYRARDATLASNVATVTITVTPVNDAPVAVNDSYTVAEDGSLTPAAPGVLGNDSDDSGPLSAVLVTGASNGTLTLNADGSFSYAPNSNFNGPDSFTYKANDGTLDSNTVTVSITVTPVNDAPVAVNDSYSVGEDGTLTVAAATGVLANDTDAEGSSLSAALVATTTKGTLTLAADGSYSYAPNANVNGTDTFTYRASDGSLSSNVAMVTITVNAVNDAPSAVDDSYSVGEDGTLTIAATAGVLANDTDIDSAGLTAALVGNVSNGTLALNANGSFTYTPNANFNGTDTFTYRAGDGTASSSLATVTITVNAVNDAPVAADDSYSVGEDGTLATTAAAGVLANDTDDSGALSAVLVTGPSDGTLTLNPNGSFTYSPNANFNGSDSFIYRASDGTASSNLATVTITVAAVNDAPVAADDSYAATEGTPLTIAAPGLLDNDSDVEGSALSAVLEAGPSDGTLTLNANGSFTYTPNANFNGSDSFTYKASEGLLQSNVATVTITVSPVNDAPLAVNDGYSVDEDGSLTIAAAAGVLANDSDPEGSALSAVLVATTTNGTLTLNANGSFSYVPNANVNGSDSFTYRASDGSASSNLATVTITVNAVNDAPVAANQDQTTAEDTAKAITLAASDVDSASLTYTVVTGPSHGTLTGTAPSLTYTPAANYHGGDSFTFRASDGTANSNVATVSITVTPVNDAPVAANDSATTAEDSPVDVDVLLNDTDVEGSALTIVSPSQGTNGSVTLVAGKLRYTPNANFSGSDSFTYRASDGTASSDPATVTITVNAVNDAPVAANDGHSVAEDSSLTVAAPGVLGNDSDVEGTALSAELVASPTNGTLALDPDGSFVYTPNANFHGSDSFTYQARDATLASNVATVTITVTPVNDAPVAVNDSYTVAEDGSLTPAAPGVLGNDSDDSGPLSAVLVTGASNGTLTLNADGSFSYAPNSNFNGPDSFTYKANDGTLDSNTVTVSITVTAVNDAPVAAGDSYSTAEGTPLTLTAPGVLGNDVDIDSTSLTAVKVSNPAHGSITLNADGSFTYAPSGDYNGGDSFTYQAADATASSNIATVTITVTPVNDAPVAVNDAYGVDEDQTLTVAAPGVLGNDSDVDGGTLSTVLVTGPSHGTLTLNADGSLTYRAAANYSGSDGFTYKATDSSLDSNVATVSITVNPVNDAPVAGNDSYSVAEDGSLTVAAATGVLANDTDAEGSSLSAALVATTTKGTLTLAADGSFNYAPNANVDGTDAFTYRASEGSLTSNVATVTITITPVNDAPAAANDSYSVGEDGNLTIAAPGVLTNDTDIDSASLTAALVADVSHGTLTLDADGSFSYAPASGFNGTDSFTYRAGDGTASSNVATVTITVSAANDPPVAVDDAYSVAEDGNLTIAAAAGVLANDTDDSGTLSAALVTGPGNGTLTLNASGSFSYAPNANFHGIDSFTYRADDGEFSSVATVTITVNAVNDAPSAVDDAYSVGEDGTLTIAPAAGVLANDSDIDSAGLTAALAADVSNGTLGLNANGSLTYAPNANFNGIDSFTYRAGDGAASSNLATVTITITPVNDRPVANADGYTTTEDQPLSVAAAGILANDTDVDSAGLTAVLVSGPASGTLTLNANGSFSYTPAANFHGTVTFSYQTTDGELASTAATVTITVNPLNDAPAAQSQDVTTAEDTAAPITLAATDADANPLTYAVVAGPSHGSLSGSAPNLTYTPALNYHGPDSLTFKANDGTVDSNVATVAITVTPVNDAPVAPEQSVTTAEDTAAAVTLAAIDVDSTELTYTVIAGPTSGSLTGTAPNLTYTPASHVNGTDSFTYRANDGTANSNVATVSITVTPVNDAPVAANDSATTAEDGSVDVNVLLNDTDVEGSVLSIASHSQGTNGSVALVAGKLRYTPQANFHGSDTFTYRASDGSASSEPATVTITVTPVNDAPTALVDSYSTAEGTPLTIPSPGVLGNDSDIDSASLIAVQVTDPAHGTVALNANGSFTYTPTDNYSGFDSFTYKANDGLLDSNAVAVTIDVGAVNDAPVAANDAYTVTEDANLTIATPGVLSNDTDAESASLTAALVSGPSHGTLTLGTNGAVTYAPATNFNGTDSFTYKASDGALDSNVATVTITVTAVNDAPLAGNDSYSVGEDGTLTIPAPGVLSNDPDPDSANLTAVLVTDVSNGTLGLNANGSFTYSPAGNFNGTDSFTYRAGDGTANSNVATVSITVTAVNDVPTAVADSRTTGEDTTLVFAASALTINDTPGPANESTQTLSVTAVAATADTHGAVGLTGGSITYTPAANFNGAASFSYTVRDNGTTDGAADPREATGVVNVTVTPSNDAPVAANNSYGVNEDNTLTVAAPGILGNDTDIDLDSLTAVEVTGPTHGTLTLNANGSFAYAPSANYNGSDSFTYRANDGTVDSNVATVTITVAPINDAPAAQAQSATTAEDTAKPVVLAATDVDSGALTYAVVVGPTNGSLTGTAPNLTYTPATNYHGPDSFTFKANDGTLDSNIATVSITVTPVNDAPVAANDSATTAEDGSVDVDVLLNDTDVEGSVLTIASPSQGTDGSVSLVAGKLHYTPQANFHGSDTFTYRASDGSANSEPATVTITVTPVNDAPTAHADSYSTAEGTPLTIASPGVLGNDSDIESASLTAVEVTGPAHGSVTLNANGSFTYTPSDNYSGLDSFSYKANDGLLDSNAVAVTIDVGAVNDAPVAHDDTKLTAEDTTLVASVPAASDPDGDALSYALVSGTPGLSFSADGSYSYAPPGNFNGTVSFTYRASDALAQSNIATVSITVTPVNDRPVANADGYSTAEDAPLNVPATGVLGNDTDIDNASLTAALATGPTNGTLGLNANGSFTYTPNANFNGSDSFTYQASDGALASSAATVTITVSAVNDAPAAQNQSVTTAEDTAAAITLSATDDSATLSYTVVANPAHGTLSGSAPNLTYTPTLNYHGPDSFTFKANDGTLESNVATVTLTVTPVNDAPVAPEQSVTTGEDTAAAVTLAAIDVDSAALTYTVVTNPTHGSLTGTAPNLTYTPASNYHGGDSFTYRASDGSASSNLATVTITVTEANDVPTAANDGATTAEDSSVDVDVLANDTDAEASALSINTFTQGTHGSVALVAGKLRYTPQANFHGSDTFTYRASDGTASSDPAAVSVTVTAVNDAPVALNESVTTAEDTAKPITLASTDADANPLTYTVVANPTHGSLSGTAPNLTYTPAANYHGPDSFTFKASDGTLDSNIATVSITVTPVNDAPVAANDPATTAEDGSVDVNVLANDTDVDEGSVLSIVSHSQGTHGSVALVAGKLRYMPQANFHGSDTFTYRASDGSASSEPATVTITVTPVNDTPTALADSYSTAEGTPLTIASPGVLGNDSDIDSASLTAVQVTDPAHGSVALNANGSFTYTPNAGYNGSDSFTYKANDGTLDSNVVAVAIDVGAVNDAPVAANDAYSVNEDANLTITAPGLLGNDSDVDSSSLTATKVTNPAHGTVTVNGNGSFSYTPDENYNGADSFTYKANDGALDSNAAAVTITVSPVNDAPVAPNQSFTAGEDTAAPITLTATDVDAGTLTYTVVAGPTHGSLTGTAPNLAYIPAPNYHGGDSFTFKANDGTVDSNVATVTITVTAVNDAPIAGADAFTVEHNGILNQSAPGVLGNDRDVESGGLTAALVANPSSGTLSLNPNGSFVYTPNAGFSGSDSFTYKASDGTLDSNIATVSITVGQAPPPAPPPADQQPPTDPLVQITSHKPGVASSDRTIEVTWNGATDAQSGVDGFSFHWDNQPLSVPDTIKDAEETATGTKSPALSNGSWYFHLRTRDNAGNWTATRHFGPFMIAVRAPQQVRCVVPNLKGMTLAKARALLVARRCGLGRVTRAHSRLAKIGRIISQSRRPGARLPRGTKVNVVVSRGRRR